MASKFLLPNFTPIDGIYFCVFSFTLISTGTLFMLPYLSELKTGNGLLYKPITYISLISYSMYLLNLSIVQRWIISNIPWEQITDNGYIKVVSNYSIYWLLVIGLSILIYKYLQTFVKYNSRISKPFSLFCEYSICFISHINSRLRFASVSNALLERILFK